MLEHNHMYVNVMDMQTDKVECNPRGAMFENYLMHNLVLERIEHMDYNK